MINIKLNWEDILEEGAESNTYDIYKAEYKYNILTLPKPFITGLSGTSYTDYDIESNKTYYYMIGIIKPNGSYSLSQMREVHATNRDLYIDFVSAFVIKGQKNNKAYTRTFNDIKGNRTIINNNNGVKAIESRFGPTHPYALTFWGNSTTTTASSNYNARISATIAALGKTDFTYEIVCSIDKSTPVANARITQFATTSNGMNIIKYGTEYPFRIAFTGSTITTPLIITNSRYEEDEYLHICLMRYAGTFYLFVNGKFEGSATTAINTTATNFYILSNNSLLENICGRFDSCRLTKGINRYPLAGFEPPNAPFGLNANEDPYFANVDLLIQVHDGEIKDYSNNNRALTKTRLEYGANKLINNYLFNEPCIYFDGVNGHRLYSTAETLYTNDFTIEFYMVPDAVVSNSLARVMTYGPMSTEGMMVIYYPGATSTRTMQMAIYTGGTYIYPLKSHVLPDNKDPFHVCVMRKNGIFYMFIDGEMVSYSDSYKNVSITEDLLSIGMNTNNGEPYIGGLYDIRITNKARYLETGFHIKRNKIYQDIIIGNVNTFANENNEIVLSWEYNGTEKSPPVFDIYRSDTEFTIDSLPDEPIATGLADTYFIDTTAEFNTFYYYGIVYKLENRQIGYNLYVFRGVVTDSDLQYDNVVSIIETDTTINKTTFITNNNGSEITYTNTVGVYTVGPYFNDHIGFVRIDGNSTTANNTDNGKLTGLLKNALGTADFTIEIISAPRFDKCASDAVFFQIGLSSAVVGAGIQISRIGTTNKIKARFHDGAKYIDIASTIDLPTKQYSVISLVKYNGTFYLYINGTMNAQSSSLYSSLNFFNKDIHVGSDESNIKYFNGTIDSIRVTSGLARYTYSTYSIGKFTISELSFDKVSLLLDFNEYGDVSTDFIDLSNDKVIISAIGNIANYELHRVGANLLYFDGASNLFNNAVSLAKDDFTIELTYTPILTSSTVWQTIFNFGTIDTNGCIKLSYYNGILQMQLYNVSWKYAGFYEYRNKAMKIAVMRKAGILYLFVDGICVGSYGGSPSLSILNDFYIGKNTKGEFLTGFLSDIRITKASRYINTAYPLPMLPYKKYQVINIISFTATYNGTDAIILHSEFDGLMKKYAIYKSTRPFVLNNLPTPILIENVISENIEYIDTNIERNKLYYYMIRFTDDLNIYRSEQITINTFDIIEWTPENSNTDGLVWLKPENIVNTGSSIKWSNFNNTNQYFESVNNPNLINDGSNALQFTGNSSIIANQNIVNSIKGKNTFTSVFVIKQPTLNPAYETIIDICNIGDSVIKLALGSINNTSNKISARIISNNAPITLEANKAINDAQYHIIALRSSYINKIAQIYIDGTIVASISLGTDAITPPSFDTIKIGANNDDSHGLNSIIKEGVIASNMTAFIDNYIDRLNGYMAHKYAITSLLPTNHPYKLETPKLSYAIFDSSIEFSNYANRLSWNVKDFADSFKIYRGYSLTTINKNIPYAEVYTTEFIDTAIVNNENYYYQIDHILDGAIVSSEILNISTNVKGIWAISTAQWGTNTLNKFNPTLTFEPTWEENFRNTISFLIDGYTYQLAGRYTGQNVNGIINVNPQGLKFELFNYARTSNNYTTAKLYFEDDAGNCYGYIYIANEAGTGYPYGTRVYYGVTSASTTEAGRDSYAQLSGELEIRPDGIYYTTKIFTNNYIRSFNFKTDTSKITRIRIDNMFCYNYQIVSNTLKGSDCYFYLKCI